MTRLSPILTTGDGPDVVLLHGYPVNTASLQIIVDALSDDFRVHTVDTTTTVLPDEECLDVLEATLLEAGLQKAALIGHSIGGYRALFAGIRGRLTPSHIVGIGAYTSLPDDVLAGYDGLATQIEAGTLDVATVAPPLWFGAPFLAHNPDIADTVRAWTAGLTNDVIAAQLRTVSRGPELLPELSAISCPTLLLVGSLDVTTPPAWSHAIAEQIPNAHVEIIEDSGHFPFLENPRPFFPALRDFLVR